jgi:hypothetical protein
MMKRTPCDESMDVTSKNIGPHPDALVRWPVLQRTLAVPRSAPSQGGKSHKAEDGGGTLLSCLIHPATHSIIKKKGGGGGARQRF